jgi:hypothetical protein
MVGSKSKTAERDIIGYQGHGLRRMAEWLKGSYSVSHVRRSSRKVVRRQKDDEWRSTVVQVP